MTAEKNKLIDEFMGVQQPHLGPYAIAGQKPYSSYHNKWELLMPVVEKINVTFDNFKEDGDETLPFEAIQQVIHLAVAYVDIKSVHEQCFNFISLLGKSPKEIEEIEKKIWEDIPNIPPLNESDKQDLINLRNLKSKE